MIPFSVGLLILFGADKDDAQDREYDGPQKLHAPQGRDVLVERDPPAGVFFELKDHEEEPQLGEGHGGDAVPTQQGGWEWVKAAQVRVRVEEEHAALHAQYGRHVGGGGQGPRRDARERAGGSARQEDGAHGPHGGVLGHPGVQGAWGPHTKEGGGGCAQVRGEEVAGGRKVCSGGRLVALRFLARPVLRYRVVEHGEWVAVLGPGGTRIARLVDGHIARRVAPRRVHGEPYLPALRRSEVRNHDGEKETEGKVAFAKRPPKPVLQLRLAEHAHAAHSGLARAMAGGAYINARRECTFTRLRTAMSMRRKAESTEASISVENNVIGVAAGFQDPFTKTKVTAESALRAVPMGVPIDHAKILKTIEEKNKDFPTKTVEIVPAQVYEVIGYIIRMQGDPKTQPWVKIHSITRVPTTFVKDRVAREELRTCKEHLKALLVAAEKRLENGKTLYTYLKSFTDDKKKASDFQKMHRGIQEAYEHCHDLVAHEAEAYRINVRENQNLEDKLEKDRYFRPRGWHAVKGEDGTISFLMSMKKERKASGKRKPKTKMSRRSSAATSEGVPGKGGKQENTTKKPIEKFTLDEVANAITNKSVEERHHASVKYWARKASRKMKEGVDKMDSKEMEVFNYARQHDMIRKPMEKKETKE